MEIATYISDSSSSKEKVDEHFLELLNEGVEAKDTSLEEFSGPVGEDAMTSDSRKKKALPSHNRPKEIDLNFLIL